MDRPLERWATFDCYGTLVDWNAGVRAELTRLFGESVADTLLDRYHDLEPRVQSARPDARYTRCWSRSPPPLPGTLHA